MKRGRGGQEEGEVEEGANLKPEQSGKKSARGLRATISQQPRAGGAGNELESLDLGKWRKCT